MHQVYSQIAHWRWNQNSCYLKYPRTGRLLQLSPNRGTQFCHPSSTHDSFLYHPIITTLHRSCKNCTSFSLQKTSSTNLHACAFCYRSSLHPVCFFSGPSYLSELLHVYTPSCILCSSSDLKIQQYTWKINGSHSFSYFWPHIWNLLPQDLRHCSDLWSFKTKLKTLLFLQYFTSSKTSIQFCQVCVCECVHAHVHVCTQDIPSSV